MMNGYRWDPAKHEFLIILQISSGHTNLYISDLGVIVQFSKNKTSVQILQENKDYKFLLVVRTCWTDGAIFKERAMGAEQDPSFCANPTSPGDLYDFITMLVLF